MIVMNCTNGEVATSKELTDIQHNQLKRVSDRLGKVRPILEDARRLDMIVKGDRVMLVGFGWCRKDGEAKLISSFSTNGYDRYICMQA
jgi:hypothetical protein